MIVKLVISYDGTLFCGWQIQPNGRSVQQELQTAIKTATGQSVTVVGSGRTDSGVHALGQVASMSIENCTIPPQKLPFAINPYLPDDVKVLSAEGVADDFNALRCAKKKTYRYSFYKSDVDIPLKERYATRVEKGVGLSLIKSAAKRFVGTHDFKAFNASGGGAVTTVRTVYKIDCIENGDDFYIEVTGNGFLYNMVRILAGTLILAGQGKLNDKDIDRLLLDGDRTAGGKTFPAKGLCLMKVEY
ncbi:MAG: tRNA pseudouridine(38-40) synthase TruA [Clostridiales bacterium]|nr:tRNA pseudouridine(38-40) synthase TruA [Clostridiales bacterium]